MEFFNIGNISKDNFRLCANKLLNECFILKSCAETKSCYYFILRKKEVFSSYFDFLGYDIVINEEYGVICLNNSYGTGRLRLRLLDSIILLILRIIYIEEQKKLNDSVIICVDEVYDRYYSLREKHISKTDMRSVMSLLRRYHIIKNIDTDMGNPDTRIQIYPSVILSVDSTELNRIYENTQEKLNTYVNGGEKYVNEEDSDEIKVD
ncbi:MAG: DUF4194 domain-containing protein [Ruminococcus sp.]|nr:DUF4194 domain-containing protein [Ruminococcus sp.]